MSTTPCLCGDPLCPRCFSQVKDDLVECPRCKCEHEHVDAFVQFSRYMSHWRCPCCGCNWAADLFSKTT